MPHVLTWRNGSDLLFDDSFEHAVVNDASERRIVLFLDVERQDVYWFAQPVYQAGISLRTELSLVSLMCLLADNSSTNIESHAMQVMLHCLQYHPWIITLLSNARTQSTQYYGEGEKP